MLFCFVLVVISFFGCVCFCFCFFFHVPPKWPTTVSASRILTPLHIFICFAFLLASSNRARLFPAWILFMVIEMVQTWSRAMVPLLLKAVPQHVVGSCGFSDWLPFPPSCGFVPLVGISLGWKSSSCVWMSCKRFWCKVLGRKSLSLKARET